MLDTPPDISLPIEIPALFHFIKSLTYSNLDMYEQVKTNKDATAQLTHRKVH
jgi:hypothetical protein